MGAGPGGKNTSTTEREAHIAHSATAEKKPGDPRLTAENFPISNNAPPPQVFNRRPTSE